jgi:RNA-binding protein
VDKKRIRELRGKAQSLDATVHVGKEGITETVAGELKKQLEKNKLVKVRLLQSFEEPMEEAGKRLADASGSTLVEVRGRTVVLARE